MTEDMKAKFERDGYIIIRYAQLPYDSCRVIRQLQTFSCPTVLRALLHACTFWRENRSVLSGEELARLKDALEKDGGIMKHSYVVGDDSGRCNRMCLWNHPGDDITGMVARSEKVAGTMEKVS